MNQLWKMNFPEHLQTSSLKRNACFPRIRKKSINIIAISATFLTFVFFLTMIFKEFSTPSKALENTKTTTQNYDGANEKEKIYTFRHPDLFYPEREDLIPRQESIEKEKDFDPKINVEIVPNEGQDVIEDPVAYVKQTPERPLLPGNFYQNIDGVGNLEISPGVIVLHNFSAIPSSRVMEFGDHKLNVTTYDSGYMKEHFLWLPPFDWKLPNGLNQMQINLFWKQPENHWHFDDCKMWNLNVVWEVQNGESAFCNKNECINHNYTHHLNFCNWPNRVEEPKEKGKVFIFSDHYVNIFQHFFDNGIPHIATMALATGYNLSDINVMSGACNSLSVQILERLGFKSTKNCIRSSQRVSAETLIMIPSMRVLHPLYYEWFRENMKYPSLHGNINSSVKQDKIVILPRGVSGGGGGDARIIYNIEQVKERLQQIHGKENVIMGVGRYSLDHMISFYSEVKAILGPHGGAFYNHFFAPPGIDVVEMIPMMDTGKYPLQNHWNKNIPFAHLAFLSNVQLNNQKFWRYISMNSPINYNVDVDDFMEWIKQIPSLANPGPANGAI